MKDLLIYGVIWSHMAAEFLTQLGDFEGDELVVRVNSPGGEVVYGWGIISKFNEFVGKKTIKVDGQAHSMGAFICAYADNVEAIDTAQFVIHRAAYPKWLESAENFIDSAQQSLLEETNKSLMTAFKNKIDVPAFEKMKGIKVKDLFAMKDKNGNHSRIDITLTAQEAKKIGLVDKVVKITPAKSAKISSDYSISMAAMHEHMGIPAQVIDTIPAAAATEDSPLPIKSEKINKMTASQFQKENPEAYAAIVLKGQTAERDRVGAWLAFNDVDPEAVAKGIASGDAISQTAMADFSKKMFSNQAKANLTEEAADAVETGEAANKEEKAPTATSELEAQLNKELNIKVEK